MQLVETVLGNVKDAAWKAKLADASVDVLELSQWDAQKNRLRKETKNGLNVAVSLDRDTFLHDGDVLLWDEDTRQAVICKIDLCEVLVIDLGSLSDLSLPVLMERSVALGHALGNQHWPAVVREGKVYVPLAVDKNVMNSVMGTHHFADIRYHFAPGAEIADLLPPAQSRRLFGGSEVPIHEHGHSHGEQHPHHKHGERHDDGHCRGRGGEGHHHHHHDDGEEHHKHHHHDGDACCGHGRHHEHHHHHSDHDHTPGGRA